STGRRKATQGGSSGTRVALDRPEGDAWGEHPACRPDLRLVAAGTRRCFREHVGARARPGSPLGDGRWWSRRIVGGTAKKADELIMSGRRRPTVPSAGPRASSPRLMITQDSGALGRARVIGSLTGDAVQVLLDAVDGGIAVLDLAEVVQ